MKDVSGVKITRTGLSALSDIMRGLAMIDSIYQDATGSTRHAQGTQAMPGTPRGEETLGEYERKLQMIDQRFLDVGREIEEDFHKPLLKYIYLTLINEKLFDQNKINKLTGMREIEKVELDEAGNPIGKSVTKVPKLDLAELKKIESIGDNFKCVGITQFIDKTESLGKLEKLIELAGTNPMIAVTINLKEVVMRWIRNLEIEDWEALINEEKMSMANMLTIKNYMANQGQGVPAGQGGG